MPQARTTHRGRPRRAGRQGPLRRGQGALPRLARLDLDELRRLRRLRPRARGGLRGARGQAAGLRRAARAREARLRPRDEHLEPLGRRRWAPTSASTSSTRSRCCRSSSSSARRTPTTRRSRPPGRSPRGCASAGARRRRAGLRRQPRPHAPDERRARRARARHRPRRRPTRRSSALGLPMAPSVLLQMVGPRVANHVLETLHDAYPDRFPLSPTLADYAEGKDEIVVREHAPRSRDEILETRPRGARRRDPPPARRGRRRRRRRTSTPRCCSGAGWPFWLGGITKYLDQVGISEKMFGRPLAEVGAGAPASMSDNWRIQIEATRGRATGSPARPPRARPRLRRGEAARRGARRAIGSRSPATTTTIFVYAEIAGPGRAGPRASSRPSSPRRASRRRLEVERWLAEEERWSGEPPQETWEQEELGARPRAVGGAGRAAIARRGRRARRHSSSSEGYDVVRRWRYLIVGAGTEERREDARAARARRGRAGRRGGLGGHAAEPVRASSAGSAARPPARGSAMLQLRRSPTGTARERALSLEIRSTGTCCRHAGNHRATDAGAGGSGRPSRRRPPAPKHGPESPSSTRTKIRRSRLRPKRPGAARSTTRSRRSRPARGSRRTSGRSATP